MQSRIFRATGDDAHALAALLQGLRCAENMLRTETDITALCAKEEILIELGRWREAIGVEIEIINREFDLGVAERLVEHLLREKEYRKVVEIFETKSRNSKRILLGLIKSYFELGDLTRALQLCDEQVSKGMDGEFMLEKIRLLYVSGMKDVEKLLVEIPEKNADALAFLGNLCFEKGKYRDALQCFTKYLKQDENVAVWFRKGLCHLYSGELWSAEFCFDYIIGRYPESAYGWYGKHLVMLRKGKKEVANQFLKIARENEPEIDTILSTAGVHA
jgi:tetratricopeptide (TPR) repeat protein